MAAGDPMKKMHYLLLVLVLFILCGCDPKDNEDPAPQRLTGVEWVVHTEGELGLVQGDSAVIVSVDADGNKLVYTRLGYIFSSADGLNWVEIPAQNRETTFPENEIIYICDMAIDRQGRVWLATTIGLACFSGNRWDLFNSSNSPMATDWISCLFADNADRIWISASNHNQGGLMVLDGTDWTSLTPQNSALPSSFVCSIHIDPGNVAWVGTDYGLARINGENWTIYDSSNSALTIGRLSSLASDSCGILYVGKDEGEASCMVHGLLARFDGTNWSLLHPSDTEKVSDSVTALMVDNHDHLWVATAWAATPKGLNDCPAGLAMYNGEEWFVVSDLAADFPQNAKYIFHMAVDKNNTLWFVKKDTGLISLRPQLN